MRTIQTISISMIIAVFSTACTIDMHDRNQAPGNTDTPAQELMEGKEYTSQYVCPMHCEGSGSDEPGQCPVCGMDYVENSADSTAD